MKKRRKIVLLSTLVIILIAFCINFFGNNSRLLKEEKISSIKYFIEQSNTTEKSSGYGLVRDRYPGNPSIASIAATGYGLSSLPMAVEEKLLSKEDAFDRANKTLDTLLNMETIEGFYYHFININTGEREWNSELSNIDTAILICGALHAGEYFGGEIKDKANKIYEKVNWPWFVDSKNNQFYMAYSPEKGFQGHWDYYAEQLMMYVLGAGSPTFPIDQKVYNSFTRNYDKYGEGNKFIHSWFGSIFTYQFSHGWIDFRDKADEKGVNWFNNSVDASLASYNYSMDLKDEYKSFAIGGWGLTACDTPDGYNGLLGSAPSGASNTANKVEGTIAPAGALGSIVFTPKESIKAVKAFDKIEGLKGEYGYKDAFNLDKSWIANDYIGIDKGITMIMIGNYEDEEIWKEFMKNEYVNRGLEKLEIK